MRRLVLGLLAAGLLAGCVQVSVDSGVSLELARERAARISDIRYELAFRIPEDKAEPLEGTEALTFTLKGRGPVQLDFREGADNLRQLTVNGKAQKIDYRNEHIVLHNLHKGENRIDITFTPGDQALNRNEGYLYTLLVPALARTVFPAFDQPNLKAVFSLRLDIPEKWVAVSDGSLLSEMVVEGRKQLVFNDTKPIPTYLFSFVAGQWQMAEETVDGFPMHFYYRETDPDKLAQIPEVFRQVASAVRWMGD